MALAKRTLIMVAVVILVLVVGLGGGLYAGLKYFSAPPDTTKEVEIPDPGPMLELGQFTSTMADPEIHVVTAKVTVELENPDVLMRIADPGWSVMMKDEVLKTLKDQRYDNVRYAEGMEKLKQDLKVRLNSILPRVNDKAAVKRVLFDEFMTK